MSEYVATPAEVVAICPQGPVEARARSILKPFSFAELSVQVRSIRLEEAAVPERAEGGGGIVPSLFQGYRVKPDELRLESPYIAHTIAATRYGFGLEQISRLAFPATGALTPEVVAANSATIQNIRWWDPRPLLETYRQLQEIRLYYDFHDVDVDLVEPKDPAAPALIAIAIDKGGTRAERAAQSVAGVLYNFLHDETGAQSQKKIFLVTIEGDRIDIEPLSVEEIKGIIVTAEEGENA